MGAQVSREPRAATMAGLSAAVRRAHRWIATLFLVTVAADFTARAVSAPPAWIDYAPLPWLFLLMASGLVMLIGTAKASRKRQV